MLLTIRLMTMKALLFLPGFCTQNSDLWERHLQYFSNFSTYLYQIFPSLWERPYSGRDGKHTVFVVSLFDPNVMVTFLDLIFSIFGLINT